VINDGLAHDGKDDLLNFGVDAAEAALDDVDDLETGLARTADVAGGADGERDAVDAADGAAAPAAGDDLDVVVRSAAKGRARLKGAVLADDILRRGTSGDNRLHIGELLELHEPRAVGVRAGSRRHGSGGRACCGKVGGGRMIGVNAGQVARRKREAAVGDV